jgi:hypothetical protein
MPNVGYLEDMVHHTSQAYANVDSGRLGAKTPTAPSELDILCKRLEDIIVVLERVNVNLTSVSDKVLGPVPRAPFGKEGPTEEGQGKLAEMHRRLSIIDDVLSAIDEVTTSLQRI